MSRRSLASNRNGWSGPKDGNVHRGMQKDLDFVVFWGVSAKSAARLFIIPVLSLFYNFRATRTEGLHSPWQQWCHQREGSGDLWIEHLLSNLSVAIHGQIGVCSISGQWSLHGTPKTGSRTSFFIGSLLRSCIQSLIAPKSFWLQAGLAGPRPQKRAMQRAMTAAVFPRHCCFAGLSWWVGAWAAEEVIRAIGYLDSRSLLLCSRQHSVEACTWMIRMYCYWL